MDSIQQPNKQLELTAYRIHRFNFVLLSKSSIVYRARCNRSSVWRYASNNEKKSIILFLAVLLVSCVTSPPDEQTENYNTLDPKTVTIAGITISSKEADILRILGKPKKIKKSFNEPIGKKSKYFYYEGLIIYLTEGYIYNLSCKSGKFSTGKGVRVGHTKEGVIAIYGKGILPHPEAEGDSLIYPFKGIDCSLVFHFQNGLVIEIEYFVNYV